MCIKNKLYLGDCLDVCDSIPSKSVDLIYLDPPFNSNKNYTQIGTDGEIRHFKDVWKDGVETYCPYMFTRVNALKRILKPTGSILFHCDRYAAAYIRVSILDPIFGSSNFQNELIWYYTNAST